MQELINQLVEKVGLDEGKASQVVDFLKENAAKVPEWLGGGEMLEGIKDKLPGGLGGMLGGD